MPCAGRVEPLGVPELDIIEGRAPKTNVVITGRDAAPELIELADTVTEMTKVKHPMDAGRKGQQDSALRGHASDAVQ